MPACVPGKLTHACLSAVLAWNFETAAGVLVCLGHRCPAAQQCGSKPCHAVDHSRSLACPKPHLDQLSVSVPLPARAERQAPYLAHAEAAVVLTRLAETAGSASAIENSHLDINLAAMALSGCLGTALHVIPNLADPEILAPLELLLPATLEVRCCLRWGRRGRYHNMACSGSHLACSDSRKPRVQMHTSVVLTARQLTLLCWRVCVLVARGGLDFSCTSRRSKALAACAHRMRRWLGQWRLPSAHLPTNWRSGAPGQRPSQAAACWRQAWTRWLSSAPPTKRVTLRW